MNIQKNHIYFHEYPDFEIVDGECAHSFPEHIHECFCVGFLTGGAANFTANGRRRLLSAGDCYVVPPYAPHTLAPADRGTFKYTVLCFKRIGSIKQFSPVVSSAKAHIKTAGQAFNIDALSKTVYTSKSHLDRMFKEQVGITPYQYYIGDRVKKIKQGIRDHISLPDLVFDLSFSDQSHLCNTFKKHMGITPTQYAGSCRNG